MKKLPFQKIFLIILSVFSIPTYALVWYLESTNVIEGIGKWNTVMLAVVVSMLPALLASIWWWNLQDED
jgi:hypothetical protein